MMKTIKGILTGLLLSTLASCNYLNVEPYLNDLMTDDSVFTKKEYVQRYLWGAAGYLPTEGNLTFKSSSPAGTATDECIMSWKYEDYMGMYLLLDEINPYTNYYNNWENYYKGIRKANTILTRLAEVPNMTGFEQREIMGLTHFLRGYYYMLLLESYGPMPIIPDEPLDMTESNTELSYPRATYDEAVDYICNDFDQAAEYLPSTRIVAEMDKPTSGAAYAFACRVRLTQASTQYNGNNYYASWTRKTDGANYINQTYDERKWAQAAVYAQKIMLQNIYQIYTVPSDYNTRPLPDNVSNATFPDGAGGIDPYHSYKDMFDGTAHDEENTELIYRSAISDNEIQICMPTLYNGWNGLGVTQKLVDAYRMNDGKDINESDKYTETGYTNPNMTYASNYELRAEISNMYIDREPRFYATIGFSGRNWNGSSNTIDPSKTNVIFQYYKDGNAGMLHSGDNGENYPLTGYTSVKYVYYTDNFFNGSIQPKTFSVIRYAEILLNYVEALNNLTRSHTIDGITVSRNPAEMVKYFNMIRYRAGLPGITVNDITSPQEFQKLIERERFVEFAMEGRRYHDLRRWNKTDEFSTTIYGMNVQTYQNNRDAFYKRTPVTHAYARRSFKPKMVFTPIPDNILRRNLKLDQNPGW